MGKKVRSLQQPKPCAQNGKLPHTNVSDVRVEDDNSKITIMFAKEGPEADLQNQPLLPQK